MTTCAVVAGAPQLTWADAFYCWQASPTPARTAYVSAIHQNAAESADSFRRRFAGYLMTSSRQNLQLESVSCVYDDSGASVRQAYVLLERELAKEGYSTVIYTKY